MKRWAGFSLIEMLISIAIFTLIAASVYSLLHVGMRARGIGLEGREENRQIRLMYQLMSKDAANMIDEAPEWKFEGRADRISFITVLDDWNKRTGQRVPGLVRITYVFDPNSKVLSRRVAAVSEGLDDRWAREVMRAVVGRAEFSYPFGAPAGSFQWKSNWLDPDEIPLGIRVRVDGYDTAISVPMGVLGRE